MTDGETEEELEEKDAGQGEAHRADAAEDEHDKGGVHGSDTGAAELTEPREDAQACSTSGICRTSKQ